MRIGINGSAVMRMSGSLEEESGWKVIVGPRDSAGLPRFLKEKYG